MLLFAFPNELFPLTYRGPAFPLLFQLPQGMRVKTASFLPLPAVAVFRHETATHDLFTLRAFSATQDMT